MLYNIPNKEAIWLLMKYLHLAAKKPADFFEISVGYSKHKSIF